MYKKKKKIKGKQQYSDFDINKRNRRGGGSQSNTSPKYSISKEDDSPFSIFILGGSERENRLRFFISENPDFKDIFYGPDHGHHLLAAVGARLVDGAAGRSRVPCLHRRLVESAGLVLPAQGSRLLPFCVDREGEKKETLIIAAYPFPNSRNLLNHIDGSAFTALT